MSRFIPPLWMCKNLLNRPAGGLWCFGAVDQPMGAQHFLWSDWLSRWSWAWCWRGYEILRAVCDLTAVRNPSHAILKKPGQGGHVETAKVKPEGSSAAFMWLNIHRTLWDVLVESFIVYQWIAKSVRFFPSNIFHATRHRNSRVALSQVLKEEAAEFLNNPAFPPAKSSRSVLHASLSPYRRWELHGTTMAELFTLIIGLYVIWRCWGPCYSSA